jgi:hypothetical protein
MFGTITVGRRRCALVAGLGITSMLLGCSRAAANPAGVSLANHLRSEENGTPVLVATNQAGVAAYASDGRLLGQLITDHTQGVQLDTRREIRFITDPPGETLMAIDLREPAPTPIPIAQGLAATKLWSDDGRRGLGPIRIHWGTPAAVVIEAGPCISDEQTDTPCTAQERAARDSALQATVAKIRLVGAAWIVANASRPLRPPRPLRTLVGTRASLSPSPYEIVTGRFCEHDCMATCLLHDKRRHLWLAPKSSDTWQRKRPVSDSVDGLCALDFDVTTRYCFNDARVCTAGSGFRPLQKVETIVRLARSGHRGGRPSARRGSSRPPIKRSALNAS